MIFRHYANYYDLFYKKKDYSAECDFLEKIFQKYQNFKVTAILDLGCGTGSHALILAKRGYQVFGVDFSPQMLKIAKQKAKKKNLKIKWKLQDIRELSLNQKFDAILALFSVINYLTKKREIISVFKKINQHLKEKGLFIFDFWWGPGVEKIKPEKRLKTYSRGRKQVVKLALPSLDFGKRLVKVNYKIWEIEKEKILKEFEEIHLLKYFFPEEIKSYLNRAGFKFLKFCPLLKLNQKPTSKDWHVTGIFQKS